MGTRDVSARTMQRTRAVGCFAVVSVALFGVPSGARTTLGVAGASSTGPSFAATKNYPVGRNPVAVAIGDLNGDGKPDLAAANSGGPSVSVLINRGGGSLRAARSFWTGNFHDAPISLAIGDLTGDRKPDVAVSTLVSISGPKSRGIIVLVNKGGGRFRSGPRFLRGGRDEVAIGDLNGDGKPELIALSHDLDAVSVLLNRGGGRFAAKVDYRTSAGPGSIAVGDLTGDHMPDLVTANENRRTISLLVNKGDGTFEIKRDFRTGRVPTGLAIGDLNADGMPDLAVANNWSHSISVLINSGKGRFERRRDFQTGAGPDSATIADFNGDRRPDVASISPGRHSISILLNRGDGTFEPRLDYAAGGEPSSLARGDLNGDGKADLATAHDRGTGSVGVLVARPGLCTVQDVRVVTVAEAKRILARANCRLGTIRWANSNRVRRGLISAQKPKPGTVLPKLGKVDVRVSRGPRS